VALVSVRDDERVKRPDVGQSLEWSDGAAADVEVAIAGRMFNR